LRWLVLIGAFAVAAFLGTAELAIAMAAVSLTPAPDGTVSLVGSGWRPGQQLVISLGGDEFRAQADPAGNFEVSTGLPARGGLPLSITIRREEPNALAFARLGPPPELEANGTNPFALLFAESLATGAQFLAVSAGGLGLATLATRALRVRRRPS
jgi:hypothetical protein